MWVKICHYEYAMKQRDIFEEALIKNNQSKDDEIRTLTILHKKESKK
jgi:hypothetical protein